MASKHPKKSRPRDNVGSKTRRAGHPIAGLVGSSLHFELSEEIRKLREDPAWEQTARNAKTLVKHPDFRIVLTVMKSGTRLREHKAAGRISIQTISGSLRLHLPEQAIQLPAGHLLALDRALPHDVEALEESAFLLSISWPVSRRQK